MKFAVFSCFLFSIVVPGFAQAQTAYPNKPVRLIVPYPAGGPTDVTARAYAEKVSKILGQAVVVDNRPGAQGVVAVQQLMQAPADGLTMYFGTMSTQVIFHLINGVKKAAPPYDPVKDLMPVSTMAYTPLVLSIGNAVTAATVAELVSNAKAHPGKLNFGSDGTGSSTHLSGELFNQSAGIQAVHVPYKGTAEYVTALIAGDIQYAIGGIVTALNLAKQGRIKILGIAGPTRSPMLPNVPTLAEGGVPGVDLSSWFGVFMRSGTNKAYVDAMSHAVQKAGQDPELVKRLVDSGLEIRTSSPEQFSAVIANDFKQWTGVVSKANLKFDN
jgi:tripartite-type tricarboxylate transporter receptor subunit TctC